MTDVKELRLVLTVPDFDAALAFYRDAIGLDVEAVWSSESGHVTLLSAGRATLELVDEAHAAEIDRLEVGRRVAGPMRVAFEVPHSGALADKLEAAGATRIAGPVTTPWNDRNVRLEAPDGTQLTLFTPAA
jgi:catechol 2,3-dioxygenase-like lactoylglutathione lyase family enzyme